MKLTIIGENGVTKYFNVNACAGCPLFGLLCGLGRGNLKVIPDSCPMKV